MDLRRAARVLVLVAVLSSPGCTGGDPHADLRQFMAETRARPTGAVEPLPAIPVYSTFSYSRGGLRSPFDKPVTLIPGQAAVAARVAVKPDETRPKEYLESFNFAALTLVGSLARDGNIWGLVDDGSGGVHRVRVGDYLGKNHGRVVAVAADRLDVVEIVPDGKGGWVATPRTLSLRETTGRVAGE